MADHRVNESIIKAGEVHDEEEKSRGVRDRIIKSSRINYVPRDFVTVWSVSAGETLILPLKSGESYDFTVDWGDGNLSEVTAYDDPDKDHTYASAGSYTVKIRGVINGFKFGADNTSATNLQEIKRWGPYSFGSHGPQQFRYCSQMDITADDVPGLTGTTSLFRAFQGCTSLVGTDAFNEWDTSDVTQMHYMFNNAKKFNADISGWDTSSVTRMEFMFRDADDFNADISSWDVSNVTKMRYMFDSAHAFNQPIGQWDTSSLTDAVLMLFDAESFDQDLSGWDVTSLDAADFILEDSGLTTPNYDALLIGWASQAVKSGVSLGVGSVQYTSAAQSARDTLTNTYNWTIDDGGLA
jgi:surface protein